MGRAEPGVSLKMSSVLRGEPSARLWSLKPRQECKRKESLGWDRGVSACQGSSSQLPIQDEPSQRRSQKGWEVPGSPLSLWKGASQRERGLLREARGQEVQSNPPLSIAAGLGNVPSRITRNPFEKNWFDQSPLKNCVLFLSNPNAAIRPTSASSLSPCHFS